MTEPDGIDVETYARICACVIMENDLRSLVERRRDRAAAISEFKAELAPTLVENGCPADALEGTLNTIVARAEVLVVQMGQILRPAEGSA